VDEPDWKEGLRAWVGVYVGGFDSVQDAALHDLMPHIDAAYQRGLMAGRSQSGYSTRRKKKETPCKADAPSAGSRSPVSTTEADG
jgi:hypothetical protein